MVNDRLPVGAIISYVTFICLSYSGKHLFPYSKQNIHIYKAKMYLLAPDEMSPYKGQHWLQHSKKHK